MKKRLISALIAVAMGMTMMPTFVSADSAPKPALKYTFDKKDDLKLFGGASITDNGNKGKALLLDGIDGYAQLPSGIVSEEMTITSWVKHDRFNVWGRVFDLGKDAGSNFFFAPYSGSASRAEIKTPNGVDTLNTLQENSKEWVHYAVTVGNGAMSYYRNGRLIDTKAINQKLTDMEDTLNYIGKSHYDADAYLAAAIDDFRVYDEALDMGEIQSVMADGEINDEVLLDSYAIENEQIIVGDKIDLPKFDGLVWNEKDNLGLVDFETGKVKHNANTETVTLMAAYGDSQREYTVYVTGTSESPYEINIDASDRSKDVSDIMWGLFFEDINSAADGGLYAEMIQNRSFEMEDSLYSWETLDDVEVNTENPLNENNPTYITLSKEELVCNDGFGADGMIFEKGKMYDLSLYARGKGKLTVALARLDVVPDDLIITVDSEDIINCDSTNEWKKYTVTFTANGITTDEYNGIVIQNTGDSDLDIDMVSLIPQDTYKGHGLRKDLMEQLEAMEPKFLRFPGGCAVEGHTMAEAWNWKDTIGDVAERKEMINIWNPSATEPYMMTYGLGFYEYFQMCEDLGMEPIPILNCGIACQVRSGSATDEEHLVPMDELQPYIDDALDLIAFANGTDETNKWTKIRIEMGHPEPFNLKYIGIGNEQYGDIYFERYAEFAKQIHEKYPDINLVTTSGTASSGDSNDLAWSWANENQQYADFMDEHYYETADWFRQHAYRYDNYNRDINTKVFLGEYASKGNTWYNALSEAAYMTGLERNADVVRMASYAPMFAKYDNVQWADANMIWFNNTDYVLTPNYYVQKLFSTNAGDYSLPTEVKSNGLEKDDTFNGGISIGTWNTQAEFKDIEVLFCEPRQGCIQNCYLMTDSFADDGWKKGNGEWAVNDDGSVSQMSNEQNCMFYIEPEKTYEYGEYYTVSLKAKKTGGKEGFQIGVALEDSENYYRVNIGGWNPMSAKVQKITDGVSSIVSNVAEQSYSSNVNIENDKWYDIRVEVTDYEIKGYLDDELVCSYKKGKDYGPVYASSVYDEETGEVIVKVVNTMDSDVDVDISTENAEIGNIAKTTVMSGDSATVNSLENKTAIVPVDGEITNAGNNFTYNAPANSLSIIRLDGEFKHEPYIVGYGDGTFRPDNTITHHEANIMLAGVTGKSVSNKSNIAITRAEFAQAMCKYMNIAPSNNDAGFTDVIVDYSAIICINALCEKGIISGYGDGTFRPDNTITRAEAVTMINKALGRIESHELSNPFTDVSPSHWAYEEILEAAVSH